MLSVLTIGLNRINSPNYLKQPTIKHLQTFTSRLEGSTSLSSTPYRASWTKMPLLILETSCYPWLRHIRPRDHGYPIIVRPLHNLFQAKRCPLRQQRQQPLPSLLARQLSPVYQQLLPQQHPSPHRSLASRSGPLQLPHSPNPNPMVLLQYLQTAFRLEAR